jgi:cyclomaltodextrinase
LHQELIGLRRRHPWLARARTEVRHVSNEQLVYRTAFGDGALQVALNLADGAVLLPVGGRLVAGRADAGEGGAWLPPHGWAVFEE